MTEYKNVLTIKNRIEFRKWLEINSKNEKECYLELNRGKPLYDNVFYYIDAIEEAICFGWIDSTLRRIDGKIMQRFSHRSKNSNWTELNKERARRLIKLNLMNEEGFKVLPDLNEKFNMNEIIVNEFKKAKVLNNFKNMPYLYQKIRMSNLNSYILLNPKQYKKMLNHTIETLKENKTFGEWNDYGRLIDY